MKSTFTSWLVSIISIVSFALLIGSKLASFFAETHPLLFVAIILVVLIPLMVAILGFVLPRKLAFMRRVNPAEGGAHFNRSIFYALLTIALASSSMQLSAQVSGTVFRDYNANGIRTATNPIEPFLAGITVKAYDASGAEVGSTTSSGTGAYSFTGLTLPLRIEFSGYATGDFSGPNGTGSLTSVQFYTAATTTANFGVNYPSDYCETNPRWVTPVHFGGPVNTSSALASQLYNASGINTPAQA